MANDTCPLRIPVTEFKTIAGMSPEQLSNMACLKSDDCFWWNGVTCGVKS